MTIIALVLQDPAARRVREVWLQLEARFGLRGPRKVPFPHVTLLGFEGLTHPQVKELLERVFQCHQPFFHAIRQPHQEHIATGIHGITDAMVKGRRIDAGRAGALLAAAELCLAHNSGFDRGFVAQVLPGALDQIWGCTCRGGSWSRWRSSARWHCRWRSFASAARWWRPTRRGSR